MSPVLRRVSVWATTIGLTVGALAAITSPSATTVNASGPQLTWFSGTHTATKNAYARPADASPTDFTTPVNYADGRMYWRLQITTKPSTKPMLFQICMWRHTPGKTDYNWETCSAEAAMPVSTTGTTYADLGVIRSWWKKSNGWDWTKRPDVVRIMIKDAATKRLMMSTVCGTYCYTGPDIDQHVPITMTTATVIVPPGTTFQAPTGWTDCPATWGSTCNTTTTTTTPPTTTTTPPTTTTTPPSTTTTPPTSTTTTPPTSTTTPPTSTTTPPTSTTTPPTSTTTTTPTPTPEKRIVVIAGIANAVGDRPMLRRLRYWGYHVTVVDDDVLTNSSIAGADLVVVSSSVVPSKVPTWLATAPVPIVVTEVYAMRQLRIASAGSEIESDSIDVITPGHPIASGLTGRVQTKERPTVVGVAKPVVGAAVIARHANRPQGAAVFAIDRGGRLTTGTAPARRAGFFFGYRSPLTATEDGWSIFDSTIAWALD
jgi:hypothetical protein